MSSLEVSLLFPVMPETTLCTSQYSLRLPTTNANKPTMPFCTPIMHCCLHSETVISFNVGGENAGLCDWNATLDARICFAAMATKSGRRREQERAWKQERGESDDRVGVIKSCYLHIARGWHIECPPCQLWNVCQYSENTVGTSVSNELCLFVFCSQVSVILVQRHNNSAVESVHRPGDVLHFKAGLDT